MLTPGILILACTVLLVTANMKYAQVVTRIRQLKQDKSKLYGRKDLSEEESSHLSNIELQISHLMHRISIIRFSIFSYGVSIVLFAVSIILTGIFPASDHQNFYWVVLSFFYGGILSVLSGVVFAVIDIWKAYRVIRLEISEIFYDRR